MNYTSNSSLIVPTFGNVGNYMRLIIFYIIFAGILSTTGNIIVILSTLKSKSMRNSRFFIIVRYLCFSRALTCLQFFCVGILKCLQTAGLVSIYQPFLACLGIYFWLVFALTIEMTLLIFLIANLILAITVPLKYMMLNNGHVSFICMAIIVVCCATKVVHSAIVQDWTRSVTCANIFEMGTESISLINQIIDNSLLGILLSLQLCLMLYVKYRSTRVTRMDAEKVSIKHHMALLPILRNQVFLHGGMQILSKTVMLASQIVSDTDWKRRLIFYGSTLVTIEILINTCALLFSSNIRTQWLG